MIARTPLRTLSAVMLSAVGCGIDEGGAGSSARTTDQPATWSATLDLRIGAVDDPGYALTRISGMEVGPDGTIYTLHGQEQVIRMFDSQGTLVRTIGGRGGGPGEFQQAASMGWVADTLWVLDVRSYRFSHFTATGEYLGSFSVPFQMTPDPTEIQPPRVRGRLFDGTLHGGPPSFSNQIASGVLTHEVPMLMLPDGSVTDSLPSIPFGRNRWAVSDPDAPNRGGSYRAQPFGDGPAWSFGWGERALVILDREAPVTPEDASFRVTKLSFEGDTIFSRAYPFEPVPVRQEEVDSILDAVANGIADSGFLGVTAGRARQWAELTLHRPAFRAGVSGLRLARDGGIWLGLTTNDPEEVPWLVLDADGEPIGRVTLPRSVTPILIDPPLLWGTETDELDVPYVVRYRVE